MMKRIDRYILRELIPPFLLAITLLSLYIMLNLLVVISDFMLDRDVSWGDLFRVLLYRLPELVVAALPISVLFTVFLSFGRLAHDRELTALQTSGVSLKRLIVPVIIFGATVSVITFAINDTIVPWSAQQYQRLLGQLLVRGTIPDIQVNQVFTDPQGRAFYVKRYDRVTKQMEDIVIYDPNGQTYTPQTISPFPQLITADEAKFDGVSWVLRDGVAHLLDEEGALTFQAKFETLSIKISDVIENLFVDQRQPRAMSFAELSERIQSFEQAGQRISHLVVELQLKMVVPLAALMYALFAAPVSLCFGFKGRAAGIIVSVLLTGTFQGAFFYAQTLARRELLPADIGPWIPNIVFGTVGILLILNVDRLSRMELGRWFSRKK
jgi:lipopolysaccharide export system permease protein